MKIGVAAALILVLATFILNAVVRQQIKQRLQSLSPSLHVTYSSIHSNILTASVSFDNLEIRFVPYPTLPGRQHTFQFVHASIKSINFFKILFGKKFSAGGIYLKKGNILVDSFLLDKKDSAQAQTVEQLKTSFRSVNIHHLEFTGVRVCMKESLQDPPLMAGDFSMHGIQINQQDTVSNRFHFTRVDCDLSELNYSLPGNNGTLHTGKFVIDGNKNILRADSLRITQPGDHENPDAIEADIPLLQVSKPELVNVFQNRIVAEKIFIPSGKIKISNGGKLHSPAANLPVSIHIKEFDADKLAVMYTEPGRRMNFTAVIHIDEAEANTSKDSFSYAGLRCNLSAVRYTDHNSHHTLEADNIEVDTKKDAIQIDDLKLIPQYSKYEFDQKLGHQADRVEGRISRVEILKPDIRRLFQNKLVAEKIVISESNIHVFRDRRLPRLEKNVPLPVAYLQTIPAEIRVKTCVMAASIVEYEEYPAEGFGKTGVLRLEKIRFTISPLINHPVATDPDHMTMNVTASIMGSGTAQASVVMPFRKDQPYHVTGQIGNLDLTQLNSSSENLGKIRIKSGFLDFLSFDFRMTNERSTGKIVGAYHRLIIQQLKKHTDEKNVADFASFMLRHLIIPLNKDASLPEKKRTGSVDYMRDPTRFVSHYCLQSLLMGVKKSFTLGFLLPK